jgi:uncharacterized protein (DUF302 family)
MIYSVNSSKTLDDLETSLREAIQQHQFGVLNILDLSETLSKKGIELGRECRVYDVCNPKAASEALKHDMRVSAVLPCRISVFEQGTVRVLSTVQPNDLMRATGIEGVEELAAEIDTKIRAIMDQAA